MKQLMWLVLTGVSLSADTVVMKNGDKLTGTVVTTNEKNVVFKSELAGEVSIAWDNITEISSTTPVVVTLSDGKTISGTVRTEGANIVTTPSTGEPATFPKEQITAVRSVEGQTKFEEIRNRELNPGFLDLYTGFYDFGVAFARGNSETSAYNSSAKLNRITANDNFGIHFNQIFASNSTSGESVTTAQAVRGGWNYARNISRKWFLQGFNDYEYDKFQNLDLRVVVGGGLGYYFFKDDRGLLSLAGGGSWNREQFATGLLRNSSEIYIAQEWVQRLNRMFSIQEKLVFFPNLSNTGAYRINFDTTLAAQFNRLFSLQFALSDRFLSNPLPGRRQNDVLYTSGIRFTVPTREKGK
jgi:putative salt-induced outer membrane protein